MLIIQNVKHSDAGDYECQVSSVFHQIVIKSNTTIKKIQRKLIWMWNTFCWQLSDVLLTWPHLIPSQDFKNIWNILHLTKMNTFIQTLWLKWTNIHFQVNTNPLLKHTVALSVVGKISQQSIIKGLTIFMFLSILSWIKWPTNGNVKMFLYRWLFFRTIHRDLRG